MQNHNIAFQSLKQIYGEQVARRIIKDLQDIHESITNRKRTSDQRSS
jgi:hypothetical protein